MHSLVQRGYGPAATTVRIGGLALQSFVVPGPNREEVSTHVRGAAYRIIAGKGYTSFGIATAIVWICEAILRDERLVLPVSTLLTGQFGIHDSYLSLPCIIRRGGIERILLPDLTEQEDVALRLSAAALREAYTALGTAVNGRNG